MSEYITFEVKGLKEMEAQLLKLPPKIARNALAVATHEGARIIRDEARAAAPTGSKTYKDYRGKIHRPGLLQKSGIVTKKLRTKDWRTTVLYGIKFSKRGYYGRWIERGKSKKHHQTERPFVVPLLEPLKEKVAEAIKARLGTRLAEIIRGIPGVSVK